LLMPVLSPPLSRILVSACLLGQPVRYNGQDKRVDSTLLAQWLRDGRVVAVCPELLGGLGVPRPAAEIAHGRSGHAVIAGRASVLSIGGADMTAAFIQGAEAAVASARKNRIQVAVLKEGSPSCGSQFTYDGGFSGRTVEGNVGVATAALQAAGVKVFSEHQLAQAHEELLRLEREHAALHMAGRADT
jgi:uncharacterized protein YbbK (DUF523 family)